jgi:hypothetical protein
MDAITSPDYDVDVLTSVPDDREFDRFRRAVDHDVVDEGTEQLLFLDGADSRVAPQRRDVAGDLGRKLTHLRFRWGSDRLNFFSFNLPLEVPFRFQRSLHLVDGVLENEIVSRVNAFKPLVREAFPVCEPLTFGFNCPATNVVRVVRAL